MHGSQYLINWSGKRGSNPRPSAWEADALPTELLPHLVLATLIIRGAALHCWYCKGKCFFIISQNEEDIFYLFAFFYFNLVL